MLTIVGIKICGMDVPTLKLVLRPILTVTSVCNTGETGDIQEFLILQHAAQICPSWMTSCVQF